MLPHCVPAVFSLLQGDDLDFALMLKGQAPFRYLKFSGLHIRKNESFQWVSSHRAYERISDRKVLNVDTNKSALNTYLTREGFSWNTGVIGKTNNDDRT